MADVTINNLTSVNAVNLTDVIPISNNSTTNKATVLQVLSGNTPLSYGTLTGTTEEFLQTIITTTRRGWLMAVGNGQAYYIGPSRGAGIRVTVHLNGTTIASDYSYDSPSTSITFTANALGMRLINPGTHDIRVYNNLDNTSMVRSEISLSWVVIPV